MNYTKAGDLEKANMVASLIKQSKESDENFSPEGNDAAISLEKMLVGKWRIYDTDNREAWQGIVTITEDLAYSCDGNFGAYGDEKGSVEIEREKNKIIMGPYEFNVKNISSGKIYTRNVNPRTMERIK